MHSFKVPVTWTTDSLFKLSNRSKTLASVFPSIPVTCILPVMSFRIRNLTFFRSLVSWTHPFRSTESSFTKASLISVLSMLFVGVLGF